MTTDQGYITCSFEGAQSVMEQFFRIVEAADRQNQFSCGLSWLDELDCDGAAESDAVSYDTLESTREFLTELARHLPELEGEGRLEHSWPVLPCRVTEVEFSLRNGALAWTEQTHEAEDPLAAFLPEYDGDEDDDLEIEIPLTPY